MTFAYRPGVPQDRAALLTLLAQDETFKPEEVQVAQELIDAALENSKDYWLRVLCAENADVLGYICFGPTPMTRATWDLYWIVVAPKHRGKGCASRLVRGMESELGELGVSPNVNVRVETSETEGYGAARSLYERLGYTEQGRFVDFYSPGDALIVYYKTLAR